MHTIDVVGVGLTSEDLTRRAMALLTGGRTVLRTGRVGAADWLREQGAPFATLDELHERADDFDELADAAAEAVLEMAESGDVVYGVIDLRDESVARLLDRAPDAVRLHPGVPVDGALSALYTGGTLCASASDVERFRPRSDCAALIREIDSAQLAGEVKLKLMEVYPDDNPVVLLTRGQARRIALEDLDRMDGYDHRCCALALPCGDLTSLQRYDFDDLVRIVEVLRGKDGCPWDRAQTHQAFKPLLIEEAYEVAGAVDSDDPFDLAEELGDVLFEVASHADMSRRAGEFDIGDVTTSICQKMIRRHPRIFGSGGAEADWTDLKMEEKRMRSYADLLRGISRALPATIRAVKLRERLAQAGLPDEGDPADFARLARASDALASGGSEAALGEALCALCSAAARRGMNPEMALNAALDALVERFAQIEGPDWNELSAEARLSRWQNAKEM